MLSPNVTLTVLLVLLSTLSLGCAEDTVTPTEATQPPLETSALTPVEIARIASDSVVYLSITRSSGDDGTGSGFFITENQIATCYHVIRGFARGTASSVYEQAKHSLASVLAIDEKHDLAIVEVIGYSAPSLRLGNSDAVQTGQSVYVLGNPRGWKGTFSDGIVSGIRPEGNSLGKGDLIQMTAPVSPGSSGGPVLDNRGEVIGVSAARLPGDAQNLNFAIPVNHLKALLKTIK